MNSPTQTNLVDWLNREQRLEDWQEELNNLRSNLSAGLNRALNAEEDVEAVPGEAETVAFASRIWTLLTQKSNATTYNGRWIWSAVHPTRDWSRPN